MPRLSGFTLALAGLATCSTLACTPQQPKPEAGKTAEAGPANTPDEVEPNADPGEDAAPKKTRTRKKKTDSGTETA